MKSGILTIVLVSLLLPLAAAQGPGGPPGEAGWARPMMGRRMMEGRVDPKTRELLEQVMMARISNELALDDAQTVLLVRRFSELREKVQQLRRQRAKLAGELREAVEKKTDEAAIEEKLGALLELDKAAMALKSEMTARAGEGLTPWQRAKLYLFMEDFDSDMRRLLMRAQEGRGRFKDPGGETGPRGPGRRGEAGRPGGMQGRPGLSGKGKGPRAPVQQETPGAEIPPAQAL